MGRIPKALVTASFVAYFIFVELAIAYQAQPLGFVALPRDGGVFVDSVVDGSPAAAAGIAVGDRVVSMDGLAIADANDLGVANANAPLGTPVDWQLERRGTPLTLTMPAIERRWIPAGSPTNIALVGFGLSLVFGVLLLWRGPPDSTTYLAALALLALAVAVLPLYPNSFLALWRELPAALEILIWPAALASMFSSLLMWAFCWRVMKRFGTRQIVAMAPGAVISITLTYAVVLAIYAPDRATQFSVPDWMLIGSSLFTPGYYFGGLVPLVSAARHSTDLNERRRAQTLVLGLAAGGTGILIFALMTSLRLSGRGTATDFAIALWLWIAVALFSVLPVSFAYATLRHRLFDLGVLVRLGLQYALARGVLAAAIPVTVLVLVADTVMHSDETVRSILVARGWTYATIGAIVTLVYFKRDDWMLALDRRFFRERYAGQQILKDVVDDIGHSPSFDAAAQKVVSRVDSALHPVMTAVMARSRTATAFSVIAKRPDTSRLSSLLSGTPITEVVRALGRPVVFGTQGLRDMPPAQLAWLAESNVEVMVPIATDSSRDEAMLVLGPRRSEEPYSREDLDLLATIGASLGLLIGRASVAEVPTVTSLTPTFAEATVGRPLLANRYRIERPIGEGGMGLVYAAVDETLERPVAIKVIKDQHLHGDSLARFQREARTAASLSHPHIVTIHDFGVDDMGSPYLVMELLEGRSLRAAMRDDGRLPPSRALAILSGLTSAVDAAHARGIIHRDLKPENVFLVSNTHAKILDYGIAKVDTASTTFGTPGVLGTLAYMSPEQAGGAKASAAWDVWSLSVIAFEMLTGQHPFGGGLPVTPATPLKTLAPDLTDDLANAIDRALSLSPANRPATANELLLSLMR